jgi:sulfur-carrier protein
MTAQEPQDGREKCPPPGASSHHENTAATTVDLVFWAGAKAVAGTASEQWLVRTLGEALRAAAASRAPDVRFDRLLGVCTVLVDGVVVHPEHWDAVLEGPIRAEILPPFAGGSGGNPHGGPCVGREQTEKNRLRVVELTTERLSGRMRDSPTRRGAAPVQR